MLFGLVLWSGFMPLGSLPSDLASRIRWRFSSSSAAPSWWRQRDGGGSGESPLNKLAVALGDAVVVLLPFPLCRHGGGRGSCGESQQVSLQQCLSSLDLCLWRGWSPSLLSRRFSGFSFLCMFLQQMRSGGVDADGDDARHQWWSWRGYGAHGGQPVLSSPAIRCILWPKGGPFHSSRLSCHKGGSTTSVQIPWRTTVEGSSDQMVSSPEPAIFVLLGGC